MKKYFCSLCIILLPWVLGACQTTGDPRQGGLFGWSEDKARDRQRGLQQELNDSTRAAEQEKAKTAEAQSRQSALQTEVNRLQGQLEKMLDENQHLEAELSAMLRTKQLKSEDLMRARAHLAENERVRKAARDAAKNGQTKPLAAVSLVEQQNQRLQKEILFLLER